MKDKSQTLLSDSTVWPDVCNLFQLALQNQEDLDLKSNKLVDGQGDQANTGRKARKVLDVEVMPDAPVTQRDNNLDEVIEQNNIILTQNVITHTKIQALQEQVDKLQKENSAYLEKIAYLESREKEKEKLEIERSLRKEKKKNSRARPVRQRISYEEFQEILETCNRIEHPLSRARVKVGFAIQYFTGLRVGNLLKLN